MKKIILIAVFLLTGISLFSQTSQEWKWVHPRPQGQGINWLKMIDANTWLIGADYGNFLKTTNAGVNWYTSTGGYPNTSYPNAKIYQNIKTGYFFDANTGYIGVQAVPGIAKTTNGGQTFDTIRILASGIGTVYGFSFLNSSTGFLCGTSTYLVEKTTNGGQNWTQFSGVPTGTYYSISATDENHIKAGTTAGNFVYTTDGGATWNTSNTGSASYIYAMKFINNNTGYVCGTSGLFRYTTDGGSIWSGTSAPTTSSLYNIVVSGTDIYLSGTVSTQVIYKSTDLGTTWATISYAGGGTSFGMNAYAFDMVGSTMAVGGTYGELKKSTNSGTDWTSLIYRRGLANLSDMYANTNGRVIAVGIDNSNPDVIMYSADGGNSWNTANYLASDYINTISMLNPSTGYISGRWGRFAKTTDGGATWDTSKTANPTLAPYFCNGVDFVNESTGWIVGGVAGIGGVTKIWKTTDAGSNWNEQASAYGGPVGVKIKMVNANTGYMAHGVGFQKTTNGGNNWTLTTSPATYSNSYIPVNVLDVNTIFTSGSNSQVYGTTNGGVTWDSLNFPVNAGTLFCTDWYNSQNGCAGGVIGVVGRTTNRGQSWQIYNVGGYTIMGVKMVHPDTIYACAGNSFGAMIFKYSRGSVTGGFTYEHNVPTDYSLKQNFPNPFNPSTTIEFNLPKSGNVSIKIFDIAGREYTSEIRNLDLRQGNYKMSFNGSELSSGIYFYSLFVDGANLSTKKMMLIK
ncbi:MAG: YCF48-related protein [Ignavibacteria bacterium]